MGAGSYDEEHPGVLFITKIVVVVMENRPVVNAGLQGPMLRN